MPSREEPLGGRSQLGFACGNIFACRCACSNDVAPPQVNRVARLPGLRANDQGRVAPSQPHIAASLKNSGQAGLEVCRGSIAKPQQRLRQKQLGLACFERHTMSLGLRDFLV